VKRKAAGGVTRPSRLIQALLWLPVGYLAVLTVAGLRRPKGLAPSDASHRFVVVVPAHDEAHSIEASVRSLRAVDYPAQQFRVLVIADNCSDATAERAVRAGADVWERDDLDEIGKGAALRYAVDRLLQTPDWDALVVVDADTEVGAAFLSALDARLSEGAPVVQGEYRVANPSASLVTRLAEVSFAIHSVLRQRARSALGAAAKLQGNGMAFARHVLEREGWHGTGLTEDVQTWLLLVGRGVRPRYEPSAVVAGAMPTTLGAARVQRTRWEAGRMELARTLLAPGVRQAMRRGDPVLLEALLSELVFPPLATLAAIVVAAGIAHRASGGSSRSPGAQLGVIGAHAVAALVVSRAPPSSYATLLLAPVVVAWKLGVKVEIALTGGPAAWKRTPRTHESS
jgi:1,2-diacylglycerol 3-beta-glucosyltransferase